MPGNDTNRDDRIDVEALARHKKRVSQIVFGDFMKSGRSAYSRLGFSDGFGDGLSQAMRPKEVEAFIVDGPDEEVTLRAVGVQLASLTPSWGRKLAFVRAALDTTESHVTLAEKTEANVRKYTTKHARYYWGIPILVLSSICNLLLLVIGIFQARTSYQIKQAEDGKNASTKYMCIYGQIQFNSRLKTMSETQIKLNEENRNIYAQLLAQEAANQLASLVTNPENFHDSFPESGKAAFSRKTNKLESMDIDSDIATLLTLTLLSEVTNISSVANSLACLLDPWSMYKSKGLLVGNAQIDRRKRALWLQLCKMLCVHTAIVIATTAMLAMTISSFNAALFAIVLTINALAMLAHIARCLVQYFLLCRHHTVRPNFVMTSTILRSIYKHVLSKADPNSTPEMRELALQNIILSPANSLDARGLAIIRKTLSGEWLNQILVRTEVRDEAHKMITACLFGNLLDPRAIAKLQLNILEIAYAKDKSLSDLVASQYTTTLGALSSGILAFIAVENHALAWVIFSIPLLIFAIKLANTIVQIKDLERKFQNDVDAEVVYRFVKTLSRRQMTQYQESFANLPVSREQYDIMIGKLDYRKFLLDANINSKFNDQAVALCDFISLADGGDLYRISKLYYAISGKDDLPAERMSLATDIIVTTLGSTMFAMTFVTDLLAMGVTPANITCIVLAGILTLASLIAMASAVYFRVQHERIQQVEQEAKVMARAARAYQSSGAKMAKNDLTIQALTILREQLNTDTLIDTIAKCKVFSKKTLGALEHDIRAMNMHARAKLLVAAASHSSYELDSEGWSFAIADTHLALAAAVVILPLVVETQNFINIFALTIALLFFCISAARLVECALEVHANKQSMALAVDYRRARGLMHDLPRLELDSELSTSLALDDEQLYDDTIARLTEKNENECTTALVGAVAQTVNQTAEQLRSA